MIHEDALLHEGHAVPPLDRQDDLVQVVSSHPQAVLHPDQIRSSHELLPGHLYCHHRISSDEEAWFYLNRGNHKG